MKMRILMTLMVFVVAIFIAMPSHADYDPSLLGYLKCDTEAAGETPDATTNGYNGTVNGATLNATGGVYDGAYEFDGNDVIELTGLSANILEDFTVAAWVYANEITLEHNIIYANDAIRSDPYQLRMTYWTNNYMYAYVHDGVDWMSAQYGTVYAETWHHFLFTYDMDEGIKLYLDGQYLPYSGSNASGLGNPVLDRADSYIAIGALTDATKGVNGLIDEVAIYGRDLHGDGADALFRLGVEDFEEKFGWTDDGVNDLWGLGYTEQQMDQLVALWARGKDGELDPVTIDGRSWTYEVAVASEHLVGDAWIEGGYYKIKLGEGSDLLIQTNVPEPATMIMFALAGLGLAAKRRVK